MVILLKMIRFILLLLLVCVNLHICAQQSSDEVVYDDSLDDSLQQLPLRIVRQPQSQIALKGSKVTFKCDYETNSNLDTQQIEASIKVKWLFNLKQIILPSKKDAAGDDYDLLSQNFILNTNSQYSIDRNRLFIASYDPNVHTGQYRCLINNTLYSPPLVILSEPANLSLANIEINESSNKEETVQLNLSEGNVAIISCKLPASNPPAIPVFYFNDALINATPISYGASYQSSSSNEYNNNRFKIFQSGNLQIANVKPSDSGVYRCSAKNPITSETRNINRKTVLKVYEPFGSKMPEIVYVPIDTNRIQIGANLTLECVANGAPVPLVSWEKFGGILPEKRSQQIFGNLILTNVQPEDKGTYVCRAENGPGQATFKTALIDIFEAPTIIRSIAQTKSIITAKKDETVELKCPIRSRPRADIQWFYQGRHIVNSQSHRISIVGDKSTLTIRNFQPLFSTGIYQCFAQNEYGFKQANLLLVTQDSSAESNRPFASQEQQISSETNQQDSAPKRPVIIMGPQNTTIYEGQSVVLLCITAETSTGNTQINWLQNDLIIEPTLMRRFEINQLLGNLRIVSIQKSDAGIYKCIASNEYGMSTAEAYVQVKSASGSGGKSDEVRGGGSRKGNAKNDDSRRLPASPTSSRPSIQQIGLDKILLKWSIVDSLTNTPLLDSISQNNIAYFKVDYKTNKQQNGQHHNYHTWLTIDEKIDPKKREYILTDLSKFETYRFRITTYLLNGELSHGQQSLRFKLEPTWSTLSAGNGLQPVTTAAPNNAYNINNDFKLSQIQVQITQIWAISSTSLGLKWQTFLNGNNQLKLGNKTTSFLLQKINGFYIYYRKINTQQQSAKSSDSNDLVASTVPLYNYTRINVPISIINEPLSSQTVQHLIDTYIIANLDQQQQYEIKMTCYNLNGDLCSFSNTIFGLTSSTASSSAVPSSTANVNKKLSNISFNSSAANNNGSSSGNVVILKSGQNEILFMILGIVLGILTLVLVIFVVACVVKNRQHKRLLAQLHNTSQKLTSSSCPTLIYEDSLRQNQNQLRNLQNAALLQSNNYTTKLIDPALFANYTNNLLLNANGSNNLNGSNDSNSTNSQSMSTTTSSMTTPPALISAQTNAELAAGLAQSHLLLLNNNGANSATVQAALTNLLQQQPPPIPQQPPPSIGGATGTLNRININLNPLSGLLESQKQANHSQQENFYHTLTTLGTLPNGVDINDPNNHYSEYNNTTLNIRAHLLLKQQQQQQQQQLLMNTLKAINLKQQLTNLSSTNTMDAHKSYGKSPSTSSMRRNNSATSSKRSKKSSSKSSANNSSNNNNNNMNEQQQQANKNYYLMPNMRNASSSNNSNGGAIYNESELVNLEAALNQNQLDLITNANNLFLLNHAAAAAAVQQQQQTSTFLPQQQPLMFMNLFDNAGSIQQQQQQQQQHQLQLMNGIRNDQFNNNKINENAIYESSLSDIESNNKNEEDEPMLSNHYAASGLLMHKPDEDNKRTKNHEELQVI